MKSIRVILGTAVLVLSACSVGEREAEPGPFFATTIHDESRIWSISIPHLSLRDASAPEFLRAVVDELNSLLVADTKAFKRAARETFDCLLDPPKYGCDAFAGFADPKYVRRLRADSLERGGLVVIRFTGYDDTLGNHPAVTSFSRAFDASNGEEIKLGDVLDSADLDQLAPAARDAIFDAIGYQYTDDDWINEGLADPASYATWWPESDGLRVTFADYAVAAHAAGTPEITIPWSVFDPRDARRLGGPVITS